MLLSFSMDYCWDYKIKITEESKKTPEKQTPRLDNILVKITMYIYVVVMSKDHRYVQTFRTKQEAQNKKRKTALTGISFLILRWIYFWGLSTKYKNTVKD